MSNSTAYEIEPIEDGVNVTYTFLSNNKTTIDKAIRYTQMDIQAPVPIYNLGFGDYDPATSSITDDVIDNNGDQYIVFGTVLSTIPGFFSVYPDAGIMVRGSDSHPEYPDKCKETCRKKCGEICKNAGRRIRMYCQYVSNNFDIISAEYVVFGIFIEDDAISGEPFVKNKTYDAILLYKLK